MVPKIKVVDAAFSYDKKHYVWEHLNTEVNEGDSVCILGANGCGKTTLFNCITGSLRLGAGQILINGKDIETYSVTELAKVIGVVYQDHAVSFPYTSLEVVRMGRTPYLNVFQTPSEEDTQMAYDIMCEMGIEHLADQSYSRISGGQRQLVLIARTLCQKPEVILFDEPTSHLDFRNQALVMRTIGRLSRKGMTIVMTSHFPAQAWKVSNKVLLMGGKGILAQGHPIDVMTEKNLENTYGVKVKIGTSGEGDNTQYFCEPDFND